MFLLFCNKLLLEFNPVYTFLNKINIDRDCLFIRKNTIILAIYILQTPCGGYTFASAITVIFLVIFYLCVIHIEIFTFITIPIYNVYWLVGIKFCFPIHIQLFGIHSQIYGCYNLSFTWLLYTCSNLWTSITSFHIRTFLK